MQPVQFNAEHTIKSGDNYRCCIRIIGEDRKMKYYKLSMDMNGENDIICHFDDKFTIPQNALIMGKYFNQWDDKTVIRFSIGEGSVWTDYFANEKGWFLVSEKLKKILESVDTDIQFLKVTVEEYNGLRLSRKYYFANVLRVVDALCLEKSKYFETEISGIGTVYTVSKYGIYSDKTENSDVFKLGNRQQVPLFVSEKFKILMEEESITGITLTEIAVQ